MRIKRILPVVALVLFFTASCSEKKPTNDIITHKTVKKAPAAPAKMQNYDHTEKVEWLGKQYTVSISRRAESDSALVADDNGNKYHNNRITVRITRSDGTEFFDKTFTKGDFASVVSADYRDKSALLGIVVDHAEGDKLYLAASIGSPDVLSDEYMPLMITVSRTGTVSISKDNRPDDPAEQDDDDI